MCEDHFGEKVFTDSIKKRLKCSAVPIHFASLINTFDQNDVQINRNREMQIEQVPHFEKTNVEKIQLEKSTTSISLHRFLLITK